VKRLLVIAICLIALTGCAASSTGSYRGIRVAEEGKWEFTPYIGVPFDVAGVKIANGISERSELELGVFTLGANVGGKYLVLDERTADDFMSLAIGGGVNVPLNSIRATNFDLNLIGGKTFGKYTEGTPPGNVYLGLGARYFPLGAQMPIPSDNVIRLGDPFITGLLMGGRIFVGGEIPVGARFMLTPEVAFITLGHPGGGWGNIGLGFTIRP